jgi:hypothetical protein
MTDIDVYSQPAEVVRRFIADMHDWEIRTAAARKNSAPENHVQFWEAANTSLAAVFARWCTPKDRKYGRLGSYQEPPEYQPYGEDILETVIESPRRACVYTQRRTGFGFKQQYVLQKLAGRWLLDNVKWQASDAKWKAGTL